MVDCDFLLLCERVCEDRFGGSNCDVFGEMFWEEYVGVVVRVDVWRGLDCAGNAELYGESRRRLLAGNSVVGVIGGE